MPEHQKPHELFSTLERFQDDETARAPQALGGAITIELSDGFDDALELDAAHAAPEVLSATDAEVFFSTMPPEAVNPEIDSNVEKPRDPVLDDHRRQMWKIRVLVTLGLVIVAALAIGLGIPLERKTKDRSSAPPTTRPTTAPKPVNGSITPQILNDTSLAAIILDNGERHLFFQDFKGAIRRMIYTQPTNQWIADSPPIAISDAKILTPIAVDVQKQDDGSEQIELFYVNKGHQLNVSKYYEGQWSAGQEDNFLKYAASPNTRQLSVTSVIDDTSSNLRINESTNRLLLLFENAYGNVTALLSGSKKTEPLVNATGEAENSYWVDISGYNRSIPRSDFSPIYYNGADTNSMVSSTLYESRPGARFSTPFASESVFPLNGSILDMTVLVCDERTDGLSLNPREVSSCSSMIFMNYASWNNASLGVFNSEVPGSPLPYQHVPDDQFTAGIFDYSGIKDSDLAIIGPGGFVIWINGTKPAVILNLNDINNTHAILSESQPVPDVSFPFRRLSSIISSDGNTAYLYHQINETTFAEEQYDLLLTEWHPSTYITVPSS